jgi:hypothetical protein
MPYILTRYPDVFGYIENSSGGVKTAYDKSGQKVAIDVAGHVSTPLSTSRAYLSHATGGLSDSAIVTSASLRIYVNDTVIPMGIGNLVYRLNVYYEPSRIGSAVTTDDWGFANYGAQKDYGSSPVWPDSSAVAMPTSCVNLTGDTDVEIRDASSWTDSASGPTFHLYALLGKINPQKMWLDVTYELPTAKPLINRFNPRLPHIPGFSSTLSVAFMGDGRLRVRERFPSRLRPVEA